MTTRETIRGWLEEAKAKGFSHLLVVCDEFDYEDYPVQAQTVMEAHDLWKHYDTQSMSKVMEVYNLNKPLEPQLAKHRNFEF